MRDQRGITLVALVVTIVVLIILAVISINVLLGENGVIKIARVSREKHEMGDAKEKLLLVLTDAQIEKRGNKKEYNQDEFLDEFILERMENCEIKDNVVIINGYAFNINRNGLEVGEYVGKEENIVFPELETSIEYAKDYKTGTIKIRAKEEESGINKIEIIQEGYVIKEYTYENTKEEITEEYTTNHTGSYVIKVYSKMNNKNIAKIEGLIAGIVYTPNGNTEYKKEHTVKVNVSEDIEKVKSIKYQWLETTVEPEENTFTEEVANGGTIKKGELTGKYYLWTLLETQSGKKIIERSEQPYYFDNKGPDISELKYVADSLTGFTLTAKATDEHTEIAKYEFYVNDAIKKTSETKNEIETCPVTGVSTSSGISCYVIVTDSLGNTNKKTATAKTQLYTWSKYNTTSTKVYSYSISPTETSLSSYCRFKGNSNYYKNTKIVFNNTTGRLTFNTCTTVRGSSMSGGYSSYVSSDRTYYYRFGTRSSNCGGYYYYCAYLFTISSSDVFSKGSTSYGTVTSTSASTYPTNGYSGSYWYVYEGIK